MAPIFIPILVSFLIILSVAFVVAIITAMLTPEPKAAIKQTTDLSPRAVGSYLDRDPRTGEWKRKSYSPASYSLRDTNSSKPDPDLVLKTIAKAVEDYSGRTKAEFSEPIVLTLKEIDKMNRQLQATEEKPLGAAITQFELSIARILKDYAKINPLTVQTQLPVRRVVTAVREALGQYAAYRTVSTDTGHTSELIGVVKKVTDAVSQATADIDKIEHDRVEGEITKLDIELQVLRNSTKS